MQRDYAFFKSGDTWKWSQNGKIFSSQKYVEIMKIVWRRGTFYGDCMVKLIWELSGNLINHVFSMQTTENLQTSFTLKSP